MSDQQTHIIYNSLMADIEIPDVSITEFVLRQADLRAQQTALIDGASGRSISFAELSDAIYRLAGGLAAEGIGPGSCIALIAPNLPEYAIVFHAVAVTGATLTTVNPSYGCEEIRHQLLDSNASLVIAVPPVIDVVTSAIEQTSVTEIITIGDHSGLRSIVDMSSEPITQVSCNWREAVVVLPYSSGTTGLPKGVMLTHYNLVSNLCQANAMMEYQPTDVGLAVLPFFHIFGMQVLMNSWLSEGASVVTLPRFDMQKALSLIQQHQVTQFFVVPPIVLGLAKSPLVDDYDVSSLQRVLSGAAPLGADLATEASSRIGCDVIQGYGMTETSPVTHACSRQFSRAGASGITAPNTQCRIVDDNGVDLGPEQDGELLIRGPQVMLGYLNNPDATQLSIDSDGWLHTGDVARYDENGFMNIVDRVKELIKYKGFQIAPAELEATIVTHSAVADVAVIGIVDAEANEVPKAFVVLKPDADKHTDAASIQQHVQQRLANYKQIRSVEFVDSIPKSPSGKILRRLLRDNA